MKALAAFLMGAIFSLATLLFGFTSLIAFLSITRDLMATNPFTIILITSSVFGTIFMGGLAFTAFANAFKAMKEDKSDP